MNRSELERIRSTIRSSSSAIVDLQPKRNLRLGGDPLLQKRAMGPFHKLSSFGSSDGSGGGGESATRNSTRRLFLFLISVILVSSFGYVVISLEDTANAWKNSNPSKNLLLTPLIKAGNLDGARKLARVNLFSLTSYSGFLTVNEDCKSHIFFWFFPATGGNTSAPLLLWHGGGPGTSGMFGLFQGTGPVLLDKEGKNWVENKFGLTKERSVLYLDSPVGTGFSYSEVGRVCYANSTDDVALGVIDALRQFYQIFPEYLKNDLYLSSSSYGGKYLPKIAWRIENDNQLDELSGDPKLTTTSINLKGIISISGFSDPIHQIDYGEFYYNLGIIDANQLKYFLGKEALGKSYIRSRHYYEAYEVIDPLIIGRDGPSYLKQVTGIDHVYNFAMDLTDDHPTRLMFRQNVFLNQKPILEAIHVDSSDTRRPFKSSDGDVYSNLVSDLYRSVGYVVEDLLNQGKQKMLFTAGQFDLIVPHTTVAKFLNALRWDNDDAFKEKASSFFKCDEKVVGYRKSLNNLMYVMFRNSGHHPFIDQPKCTMDLILAFTE